jgi:hypothetical protein
MDDDKKLLASPSRRGVLKLMGGALAIPMFPSLSFSNTLAAPTAGATLSTTLSAAITDWLEAFAAHQRVSEQNIGVLRAMVSNPSLITTEAIESTILPLARTAPSAAYIHLSEATHALLKSPPSLAQLQTYLAGSEVIASRAAMGTLAPAIKELAKGIQSGPAAFEQTLANRLAINHLEIGNYLADIADVSPNAARALSSIDIKYTRPTMGDDVTTRPRREYPRFGTIHRTSETVIPADYYTSGKATRWAERATEIPATPAASR